MTVNLSKLDLLSSFRNLTRDKWVLGGTIFAGKIIGLGLVVMAMMTIPGLFGTASHAAVAAKADTSALEKSLLTSATNSMNAINTVWTLKTASTYQGAHTYGMRIMLYLV